MAMVINDRGVRAYPTEPVQRLEELTLDVCHVKCSELNERAIELGIQTYYRVWSGLPMLAPINS